MGFFKWLDKHMRASNQKTFERMHEQNKWQQEQYSKLAAEMEEEREKRESLAAIDACANCRFYDSVLRRCEKNGVQYFGKGEDNGSYAYTCDDFERKVRQW